MDIKDLDFKELLFNQEKDIVVGGLSVTSYIDTTISSALDDTAFNIKKLSEHWITPPTPPTPPVVDTIKNF